MNVKKVRIGISACLAGYALRYDGCDKLDCALLDALRPVAVLVPVCPEVEFGLPVPRDPMHLEGDPAGPRLVVIRTRRDLTARMKRWAATRVGELEGEKLSGFILKTKSPSCGPSRVPTYKNGSRDNDSPASRRGVGLFAAALRAQFPQMPIESERHLRDPAALRGFIARALAYRARRKPAGRSAKAEFRPTPMRGKI